MKKESFSTYETAWCPGCGNFVILECLKEALEQLGKDPAKVLMAAGIGQAAKTPQYISANAFCGLHAFIKECMRTNGVIYGGEMSAHHYFRDFSYCDSGMIPWLMVTELMSRTGKTLAQLVEARVALYPCSGEINRKVENAGEVLAKIEKKYADAKLDYLDGISVEYAKWRFNIRISNTEPVMRLNVETRGDEKLLQEKTVEVLAIMGGKEV